MKKGEKDESKVSASFQQTYYCGFDTEVLKATRYLMKKKSKGKEKGGPEKTE